MMKYFHIALVLFVQLSVFSQTKGYSLRDYLSTNPYLDYLVEERFASMDDTLKVAQLLMPAAGRLGETDEKIELLISKRLIGGILMLNGSMDGFKAMIAKFNAKNTAAGGLPFLYSADAEPSLVNRKIEGSTVYKKANEIQNRAEVRKSAETIALDLKKIGINFNFAPVVDMPPNKTVGYRSMGTHADSIVPWAAEFIEVTQQNDIIGTAKHFPGHGYVVGDTHQKLLYIDGEMRELNNYVPLIAQGVLSIMIAHIAVRNNEKFDTNGLPASISRNLVTDLLRNQMNFQGLIVTDAMNMGGVSKVPQASLKAVEAGCDIVLMPLDVEKSHADILAKYQTNEEFRKQVDESVRRILRMKFCLNLIPSGN